MSGLEEPNCLLGLTRRFEALEVAGLGHVS
jgi:hypothetical protein